MDLEFQLSFDFNEEEDIIERMFQDEIFNFRYYPGLRCIWNESSFDRQLDFGRIKYGK